MAYNVFQSSGPPVSVSLFGDAAQVGAKLGKEIPNPITSVITGAIEGYETGQRIENQGYVNDINAVKAAHAEEATQLDLQQQQEQIKQMQTQNQIAQLQKETALATQDANQASAVTEAQNKALKAKQDQQDIYTGIGLNKYLASPQVSDAQKAKIFLDPQYASYFAKNPDILKAGVGSYYGKGLYTGKEADQAEYLMFGAAERQLEAQLLGAQLKADTKQSPAEKAWADANNRGNITSAFQDVQQINPKANIVDYYTNSVIKRKGMYIEGDSGQLKLNPAYDPTGEGKIGAGYDLFYKGKKVPGAILNGEDFNSFTKAQNVLRASDPGIFNATVKNRNVEIAPEDTENFNAPKVDTTIQPAQSQQLQGGFATGKMGSPTLGIDTFQNNKQQKGVVADTAAQLQNKAAALPEEERQQFINRLTGTAPTATPTPAGTATPTPTATPPQEITPTPVDYVRPSEELSPALKLPKAQEVISRVRSEPLLKDEPPLIKALAAVESGGKRDAKSPTGVRGLLQVTRGTANSIGKKTRGKGFNRDIPEQNVQAGKALLNYLLPRFDNNLPLALAAYNGGEGLILEAARTLGTQDFGAIAEYLKYYATKYPDVLSPAKAKEIANYPGKVISYLPAFAHDNDPIWTLI